MEYESKAVPRMAQELSQGQKFLRLKSQGQNSSGLAVPSRPGPYSYFQPAFSRIYLFYFVVLIKEDFLLFAKFKVRFK